MPGLACCGLFVAAASVAVMLLEKNTTASLQMLFWMLTLDCQPLCSVSASTLMTTCHRSRRTADDNTARQICIVGSSPEGLLWLDDAAPVAAGCPDCRAMASAWKHQDTGKQREVHDAAA